MLLFVGLGLAWGIPYLLIKVAVADIGPGPLVTARTGLAALLLLPVALVRHEVVPVLHRWPALLAFTVVEIVVPWLFLARAEEHLPSGLVGLLIAVVPLAGLGVAALSGRAERPGVLGTGGLLLGLAGVAAVAGAGVPHGSAGALGEVAVVVIGYAVGPAILSRAFADLPGLGVMACALTLAAVLSLPLGVAGLPATPPGAAAVLAVVGLASVCTAVAFLLLFALVGEVGPVRATLITYLNPVVAVAAGAVVLGEPVTSLTVVGFVAVLTGSALATRRRPGSPVARPAGTDGLPRVRSRQPR